MKPQLQDDDVAQFRGIHERLRRLEQQISVPVGTITLWKSGVAVPGGWLRCDGTTFNGTTYFELSSLWGTTALPADPGLTGYIAIVRAR